MKLKMKRLGLLTLFAVMISLLSAQGLETFDNFTYTGISYVDGSFTGNNGIVWNYVHSRNQQEFPIDGTGLMLRRSGDGSTVYAENIPGGVSSFSVDMRKAHTSSGVRQVELFINGESKGLSVEFGDSSGIDETVHRFEVNDIDVEGVFSLEIRHITGGDQNRQLVIDNIAWTGYDSTGLPTVSTPVFSPNAGVYYEPIEVTISTATEEATIYYTTDGSTPTEESLVFEPTSPLQINQTTTLRAKAFKPEMNPSVTVTAQYTISETVDVPDLATLRTKPQDETLYRLTNEVVLTYQQSFRYQKYVQDSTAGILIDDFENIVTTHYNVGDGITGLTGKISTFGNMLQFVPVIDPGTASSSGNVLFPLIITASDLEESFDSYESRLVTIKNVTFLNQPAGAQFENGVIYPISDGTSEIQFRTTFYDVDYIGTEIPQTLVDITGIPNERNEGIFFTARNLADFAEENSVATPTFSHQSGQYSEAFNLVILTNTEGAEIRYTTDGSDPTQASSLYSQPILIDDSITITARAFKEGMNPSRIVSASFVVGTLTIADIRDNFSLYQGKSVVVRGVITIGSGKIHGTQLRAYIQDESQRGIMLFDYTHNPAVQRGDIREVSGVVGAHQGIMQITDFTTTKLGTTDEIPIIALTIQEAQNYQYWEGTMVEVSGKLYENPYYAGGGHNVNIEDEAGRRMTVRVWDSTGIDVSRLHRGVPIKAQGTVGVFNNQTQLVPGYQDNIVIDIQDPVIEDVLWDPVNEYVGIPYVDQPITVRAQIFDYDGQIENVVLTYRLERDLTVIDTLSMVSVGDDCYRANLPAMDTLDNYLGIEDNYVVNLVATDNDGNSTATSKRIPVMKRRPVIHSVSFNTPDPVDSLVVSANIFSPALDAEVAITDAKLYYYLNYRSTQYTVPMSNVTGNTFRGSIPGQPEGTIVQIEIYAEDNQEGRLFSLLETDQAGNELIYTYPVSSHKALLRIPPRVFNPWDGEKISIGFFSQAGNKAIIRIYNAQGKLVFTPRNEILASQNGINYYDWNGRDRNNQILPIGLYVCHLEVIDRETGKKKTSNAPIVIGTPLN